MVLHAALSLLDSELPETLLENINAYVSEKAPSLLVAGREALTARYRPLAHHAAAQSGIGVLSSAELAAYLLTRMPATFAVLKAILHDATQNAPKLCSSLNSVLDLGGGPGTALWAVSSVLPELKQATVLEQDVNWIKIGKQLMSHSKTVLFRDAVWKQMDLRLASSMPSSLFVSDLVIGSYLLGELPGDSLLAVVEKAWEGAGKMLLLVEPGTPAGFERIRIAREWLLKQGGHIIAPCTHANRCPMEGSNWCHFGQKVMRTPLHMRLKGGKLDYEEEKYSYLLVSKTAVMTEFSRLLRPPRKRSKHLHLTLCSSQGLTEPVVSARTKELYQLGKQAEWGDTFPEITDV